MNKYIVKAALCSLLALPVLTSCEFDQLPEGSIPTESSWQTVSDAKAYNVGILASLRGVSGGIYAELPEIQADLFNATNSNGNPLYGTVHTWTFASSGFDGDAMWSSNYALISNANNVINNIDRIVVEEGSDDEAALKNYKATALFARAYAYSQLATYYCDNYDAATAAQQAGLPIVLTVDVNNKPARASLADTYKRITDDIAEAKSLFTNHDDADITAPTYNAARALEARVALQMKDYATAVAAAKDVMAKYPLIDNANDFSNMWTTDEGSEIIYEPQQTQVERLNPYDAFMSAHDVSGEVMYDPAYIPSQSLMDLYGEGDYRKDVYFAQTGVYINQITDEGAYIFTKFPGNEALKKQGVSDFYNMTKVFRVAEMYLIAAEAQNRLDGTGYDYIKTLREARGAKALTTTAGGTLTGDALYAEIKNEWAREMCGEGLRLACLKRWGKTMNRMTPQTLENGVLYVQNDAPNVTMTASEQRWNWEIPQNDLTTNSNLKPNWAAQ